MMSKVAHDELSEGRSGLFLGCGVYARLELSGLIGVPVSQVRH